jgi:predicted XRE-type DNA-binding protein
MDKRLLCLQRLTKRHEIRFWIRKPDMSSGEARLFLEISRKHFSLLVKNKIVPFHQVNRKGRSFNKRELNIWLVRICFDPGSEIERYTAEYLIKRGRVRL